MGRLDKEKIYLILEQNKLFKMLMMIIILKYTTGKLCMVRSAYMLVKTCDEVVSFPLFPDLSPAMSILSALSSVLSFFVFPDDGTAVVLGDDRAVLSAKLPVADNSDSADSVAMAAVSVTSPAALLVAVLLAEVDVVGITSFVGLICCDVMSDVDGISRDDSSANDVSASVADEFIFIETSSELVSGSD